VAATPPAGRLFIGDHDEAFRTPGQRLRATDVVGRSDRLEVQHGGGEAAEAWPRAIERVGKISRQFAAVAQALRSAWVRRVRFQS